MKYRKVLFVCTGNTCRSSMAEGIFKGLAGSRQDFAGYSAASRGIHAFDGDPASEHSIRALRSLWNIDISVHKAKMINDTDMDSADLILTMTRQHRDILRRYYPGRSSDIYTLKEYVYHDLIAGGMSEDISDPFGRSYQHYEECAGEIYDCINMLIDKLVQGS